MASNINASHLCKFCMQYTKKKLRTDFRDFSVVSYLELKKNLVLSQALTVKKMHKGL